MHETSVEAMFRQLDLNNFTLPQNLGQQIQGKTIIAQTMPRQVEIDRLMTMMKVLEAAYCNSSAFKDVFPTPEVQ